MTEQRNDGDTSAVTQAEEIASVVVAAAGRAEQRLLEREQRAARRLRKARERLERAEAKLHQAQARVTRWTAAVAKAEGEYRLRQAERAGGPFARATTDGATPGNGAARDLGLTPVDDGNVPSDGGPS